MVTALQVCTGAVAKIVSVGQVIVCQLLLEAAVCGVQLATGVGPVVAVLQVMVVQLLVLLAVCGVQVCTNVTEPPLQVVVKPLVGPLGVQVWTAVGPVVEVPQLVVV